MKREKNIHVFDEDVTSTGSYLYTKKSLYSAVTATKRQSEEIYTFLKTYFPRNIRILDVGCGDGTYTIEMFNSIQCKQIVAFDMAEEAIQAAKKRVKKIQKNKIIFRKSNIYNANQNFSKAKYDVGIIRGVLHHLYTPKKAIKNLSKFLPAILVLEPNGYNPILKIIERFSPYHQKHEEKSYLPFLLNTWFVENGYKVKAKKYISIVPYFFPTPFAKLLKKIEPFMEKIPFISKFYAGTYVVLYTK